MQYLILYIITILFSKIGDLVLSLKLVKETANAGYLINTDKLKEFQDRISLPNKNLSLINYIPLINILKTFDTAIKYNNSKSQLLSEMSIFGILDEMTDDEKEEYNKKPSVFRAFNIQAKREERINSPTTSTLLINNNTGKIWYDITNKDYNILKATGSAEHLSRVTQIDLIEEKHKELTEEGIKCYGDPLLFLLKVKECKNYNELEEKINTQKKKQEKFYKQAEEHLYIINQESDEQSIKEEKSKKLIRKL